MSAALPQDPQPTGPPEAAADVQDSEPTEDTDPGELPDWWHRDHPTFVRIAGFFSGLVFLSLVPAVFLAIMRALFDYRVARELWPYLGFTLLVPLGLLVWPRSRIFARYLLFGMVVTAVVVVGVSALVLWVLTRRELRQ